MCQKQKNLLLNILQKKNLQKNMREKENSITTIPKIKFLLKKKDTKTNKV